MCDRVRLVIELGLLLVAALGSVALARSAAEEQKKTNREARELKLKLENVGIQIDALSREKARLTEDLSGIADMAQKLGHSAQLQDVLQILVDMRLRKFGPRASVVESRNDFNATSKEIPRVSSRSAVLSASRYSRLGS